MKLFTFLDLKYRQGNDSLRNEFNIYKDGQIKMVFALIGFQRWLGKWGSLPLIFGEFIAINLRLKQPPEVTPVIPKGAHLKEVPKSEPMPT